MNMSQQFTCKCGKQKAWIVEGKKTEPCPNCGREYIGVYNRRKIQIVAKEVKPNFLEKVGIRIKTQVEYTQAKGCKFCLHVGTIAIYFGGPRKNGRHSWRVELLTPSRIFRFSK